MKRLFLSFVFLVAITSIALGQLVNNFDSAPADTNYWAYFDNHGGQHYQTSDNADSAKGWILIDYITDPVYEGTGAMKLEYSAHNIEGWGGYTKLEHWHPDSNAVYDWSAYDSIAFWYYNSVPQSLAGRVHVRFNLHDVSDSPDGAKTYSVLQAEYYYSFHYILDAEPGWNKVQLPLIEDPNAWNGEAFNLTGWAGISGNVKLDPDKIKGFSFEFSISGGGDGDHSTGTIIIDNLTLVGRKHRDFIFFNGRALPNNFSSWAWGQSTIEVEEGAGVIEGTNALKWVQGDEWGNGWTGMGFTIDPPYNMEFEWETDTLKFKLKAEEGVGVLRVQLEDGTAKVGQAFTPTTDNQWHDYAFKLSELPYQDGTSDFNPANVVVIGMMAEGSGVAGKVVYITDWWTGDPEIDVVAPLAPTNVQGVAGQYYNLVIWEDVPGEAGEVYNIYASEKPITTLDSPDIETVATGIMEGEQAVAHFIYYPLKDQNVEYYYAVNCKDAAGNVGPIGTSGAVSNATKGIPTIAMNAPANFVVDGDVSEWEASGIRPFVLKPETDHVPVGVVNDSLDLKATVYLAIDEDYLYVAADVVDDVYHYGEGNWWDQDAFQIFIGFYDQRGPKHTAIKRGAEADHIIYFVEDRIQHDVAGGGVLYTPEHENYHFEPLGGSDYLIEAKIPLDSLVAGTDIRFYRERGMRIPLDLYLHDNDGAGWEGNLGFSQISTDHQWQNPAEWAYTWIGDTTHVTSVEKSKKFTTVGSYELFQNYPNPFNPSTTIQYTLAKPGIVKIELFNTLGQRMKTLVNQFQQEGNHTIHFDAKELSSGIYFYRIQSGDFTRTMKAIFMK
ncbi:MAG: sugar-binding protein [bacterium]|nr:sugar-binding protein [bacterium]